MGEPGFPNGDLLELLAAVGGRITDWDLDDPADVIYRCSCDLGDEQAEFLNEFRFGSWRLTLVAHIDHPALSVISGICDGRDEYLLLATASGPPPPAIVFLQRDNNPTLN